MSEEAVATEPVAEKHFSFAGHENNNPIDMLDDCRSVVDMLSTVLADLSIDGGDSRGFTLVLDRLEKSLEEIEAVVRSTIHEPFWKGLNKGREEARGEYSREFREGAESARRNRHAD